MQNANKVVYYSDPINDDFAGNHIETKVIDDSYPFMSRSRLWKVASSALYYLIASPAIRFICHFIYSMRFKNKKNIRRLKGGYCIYGNHTHYSDVYLPPIVAWPKRAYTIANADAVSLRGFSWLTAMLGAIPIPTGIKGMPEFLTAIKTTCKGGGCIGIFPEAHIWPYYTGVRPLNKVSFRYPVNWDCPMVVMATTYQKHRGLLKWRKAPRRTVYISKPMYPNYELPPKDAQAELCARAQSYLEEMTARYSTYSYVTYLPKNEA